MFCLFTQGGEEEEFKDLAEEYDDDDDEEERFVDADKLEEGASAEAEEAKPAASWVHHQNLEGLWVVISLWLSVLLLFVQSQWWMMGENTDFRTMTAVF